MKKLSIVCCTAVLALAASLGSRSFSAPPADAYQVDAVHSTLLFKAKHFNVANFYGRFNTISGHFTLNDDPAMNSFQLEIQVESIDTANAKRDQHLKSPDFFNAKQFPTITFKSTSVKKGQGDAMEVTGDLTLHGVTRPVTGKITKTGEGKGMRGQQLAGIEAVFTIKRSDFDMKYMLEGISDEVQIIAGIEGVRR